MKSIMYYSKPQRSVSVTSQTFPDVVFRSYLWFLEKPVWKSIHIECTEHGLRPASGRSEARRGEHRPRRPRGGRGLSSHQTLRAGASCSACLLGLRRARVAGKMSHRSAEQQVPQARRAGGSQLRLPLFSHCFRVRLWISSVKMFQYLLIFLIGCSMRTLIHSNLKTFIIKKSVQINSQKRDN